MSHKIQFTRLQTNKCLLRTGHMHMGTVGPPSPLYRTGGEGGVEFLKFLKRGGRGFYKKGGVGKIGGLF